MTDGSGNDVPTGTDTGVVSDGSDDREFEPNPERVEFLREIADDVRGDSSERKQLANVLYRTSDLYDEDGDTSPAEIVRTVKYILEVNERGGFEQNDTVAL
ncbi:hypothetical protein [Natrarchaeobius oligotrophus]|uniref:Uncharacterized protein n=1 Tax=Natrarchaeobius chitinivorans TaxID=1679083 RepID=A0A3N6MQ73_NATCH|nr:hypothetical protein [Natrarchaeobius chitinivorans]RQG98361.1 hypothetical protein EA472_18300 [Natrarchaeobius chitinivorans]